MLENTMSKQTQIDVLLEEYRTLRAESHQNMGERLTLLSFPTAAIAVAIAARGAVWSIALVVVLLATYAAIWYRTWRGLDRRAQHLAMLEQLINGVVLGTEKIAPPGGLLSWETELCRRRKELAAESNPWIKRKWGGLLYHDRGDRLHETAVLPSDG